MLIEAANLEWRGEQPYARDYDDIYFTNANLDGGVEEVLTFYVRPCELEAKAAKQANITVAELGFGTGLNFAVCAEYILQHTTSRLHFISFEAHPLSSQDWLKVWPRAKQLPIYAQLQSKPLPVLANWHQRVFAAGRIVLSVYHGDVMAGLADLSQRSSAAVNAWFLDGFAPSKNPSMWQPDIYPYLAQLSSAQAHVATFTAAGAVRRQLENVGFAVQKMSRAPYKRESLVGLFTGPGRPPYKSPTQVDVIGAGIGGCMMARHLAEENMTVRIFDPQGIAQSRVDQGASKITHALMHARLLGNQTPDAQLRCQGFHYATNYTQAMPGIVRSGSLQLLSANFSQQKLTRITQSYAAQTAAQSAWINKLDEQAASQLAGFNVTGDALWFPTTAVVDLPVLCQHLLAHDNIEFVAEKKTPQADITTVLCNGAHARAIANLDWLELSQVHGQLDQYAMPRQDVALPLVGNGYFVPMAATPHAQGVISTHNAVVGATYEHTPWDPATATAFNADLNARYLGGQATWLQRYRGARTVSSDRNPVVGQIDPKLWIATGLGSMGTTMAPLAAAVVTGQLLGMLPPVAAAVEKLMLPQRFQIRQTRRGRRHGADTPIEPLFEPQG